MKSKRGISGFKTRGGLLLFAILLLWGPTAAFGAIHFPGVNKSYEDSYEEPDRKDETFKILLVLEDRIGDPNILAKTKDKLFTLHNEEMELISSLCDRISIGKGTASAAVAFSLVTALIVLS